MQEIQSFIESLESYESMYEQKLFFLKESFANHEYMVHPSIIAQNCLVSLCLRKIKDKELI
jgi:hypothetical protein